LGLGERSGACNCLPGQDVIPDQFAIPATLQLTSDPLDLSRPDHLAVLQNAFHRVPAIGGRDTML
jgi:hypothetical protein